MIVAGRQARRWNVQVSSCSEQQCRVTGVRPRKSLCTCDFLQIPLTAAASILEHLVVALTRILSLAGRHETARGEIIQSCQVVATHRESPPRSGWIVGASGTSVRLAVWHLRGGITRSFLALSCLGSTLSQDKLFSSVFVRVHVFIGVYTSAERGHSNTNNHPSVSCLRSKTDCQLRVRATMKNTKLTHEHIGM